MDARQPLPDLTDLRGFHDWWASVHEAEVWEELRRQCEGNQSDQPSEDHE